jgi:hypothetical protein
MDSEFKSFLLRLCFFIPFFRKARRLQVFLPFSLALVRNSGCGLFFLSDGRRTKALGGGERDGCTTAKAELTTDSGSLRVFGRRSVASSLYIGQTEALYIGTGGVLTSYLYIGEGRRGISKNIFFMSARDSSILALRRRTFVV